MPQAKRYRAALIGCGRMGTTIDDEVKDRPNALLPYSHAAGYAAAERVELVAACDLDGEKLSAACERYYIPNAYQDYRTMIQQEEPDILSIATRPGPHAEMVIYAAAQGVPAIYCEKPLCRSMAEADAMIQACRQHGVHFNLGVNRRYMPVYRTMRQLITAGEIGELRNIMVHGGARSIFWSHSHAADMLLFLAGDGPVEYVQADADIEASELVEKRVPRDPTITMGYVRFENGVNGYLLASDNYEVEVDGSKGKIRAFNRGSAVQMRRADEWGNLHEVPFPEVKHRSGVSGCIDELVAALDGEGETRGGIQVAAAGHEMGLGWLSSALADGRRVPLPLADRGLHIQPDHWFQD